MLYKKYPAIEKMILITQGRKHLKKLLPYKVPWLRIKPSLPGWKLSIVPHDWKIQTRKSDSQTLYYFNTSSLQMDQLGYKLFFYSDNASIYILTFLLICITFITGSYRRNNTRFRRSICTVPGDGKRKWNIVIKIP